MRKRRGQASHIFMYLMAIIIFATVALFGYQAITNFIENSDRIAFISFKTNLEGAIRDISSDYGSVRIYDASNPLPIPGKYERICFVNLDTEPPYESGTQYTKVELCAIRSTLSPIACDTWITASDQAKEGTGASAWSASEENVFLEPVSLSPIKVPPIEIVGGQAEGVLCIKTDGRINLRLEGRGDHTLIKPAEP